MRSRLSSLLSLDDFELAAQRHLPRPIFAYVSGGVEDNRSRRDNREAFDDYAFVPRVLIDITARSLETPLFGQTYAAPFGIAPMGIEALYAYRGDLVLARAAATARLPMIMSGASLIAMEEVARDSPDSWFQAYLPAGQAAIDGLLDRIQAAGFKTLVITVDTPASGNRENNVRSGFSTPLRPSLRLAWDGLTHPRWLLGTFARTLLRHGMPHFENSHATRGAPILSSRAVRDLSERGHLDWQELARIRRRWPGRLILKGVLAAEDARRGQGEGADGLIVSNHGGRQLDGAIAPLRVLPEVVAACPGLPVMMDSGVRRGTDVLKALALGACFVFVGRPFAYAASIGGAPGVAHAVSLLSQEISRDMAMLGLTRLDQIDAARHLRRRG